MSRAWDPALTDAEIDEITRGADEARPRLTVHHADVGPGAPEPEPEDLLPSARELASEQGIKAVNRLHEDKSKYPRFRVLRAVDAMIGPMAPDEVHMIGGRQGNGKSLFGQNLHDDLIAQEVPTLYIGTEQNAEVLKIKHACIRCGVTPRLVLKPREHEYKSPAWYEAMDRVQAELTWLESAGIRDLALFANTPYVTRPELSKWVTGGVRKYGLRAVIVDHIDHMDHGDGQNEAAELKATIKLVSDLAKLHHIPIIVLSQIKRTVGDPLKKFQPADAEDFAGSSAKERVADVMLSLWRPLRTDMDKDELRDLLKRAKEGASTEEKVYQPFTMGVRCVKDRLGDAPGTQCMVSVGRGGKLSDDLAPSHHGIRTNRDVA